jgi:hypothetical protein
MKIHALRHLAKVNVIKYLAVLLVLSLIFNALHFLLASIFEVYRTEFFNKTGIFGALIVGVVAGTVGVIAVNMLIGRNKPQRFVDWIKEENAEPMTVVEYDTPEASAQPNAVNQLRELEKLKNENLISQTEYKQKRDEIIRRL